MLKVENVKKSFGSLEVLAGVDLNVEQGDVVAVIGPSGSGKTTFLRCLNFLETAGEGTMIFDGETFRMNHMSKKDIARLRMKTAFVFQNYNLFLNKTALQNVMEGLVIARKMPKEKARETAEKALEKVGMSDRMNHYPLQPSGGLQQRVASARASAANPEIIYFAEPTSALDPELIGEVLAVMRQLASEGMTMIVVTHEMNFARTVANKVVFMEEGRVVETGSAQEFFQNPKEERTREFIKSLSGLHAYSGITHRKEKYMMKIQMIAVLTMLAMAGTLALTGCSGNGGGEQQGGAKPAETTQAPQAEAKDTADDLLAQIQQKGEIVIAMEGTWAPWTYHDESDKLVGYDVEVAERIAEKLGVKATFVEGEWDGLLAGLDAGRYDIMANGVDITAERQEKYDFSVPYAFNRTAVIVKGDNEEIKAMEDLNGKSTANTISSTYAEVGEKYGAKVTGVDDLNQTFELLLTGRIDATLNAEVTFYDYMKVHPDANLKIATLDPESTQVAIPVRKGEETKTLLEAINKALGELEADGELTALSEKYFGVDISKEQ